MCHYMPIIDVYAREILDSRGKPAVEVEVMTEDGTVGKAAVPSRMETGGQETGTTQEGKNQCGCGEKICHFVNAVLAAAVIGENVYAQAEIDHILCREGGSGGKCRPAANGIPGVSIAVAVTAAKTLQMPLFRYLGGALARRLPAPVTELISGGAHAPNTVDLRGFLILPCGADSFAGGLRMCAEVYQALRKELIRRRLSDGVGDAGGFLPDFDDAESILLLIAETIEKAGYRPGEDISLALDAAAGSLYDAKRGQYVFPGESRRTGRAVCRSTGELIGWLEELCAGYPIALIAGGLDENDGEGWKTLTARLGGKVILAGGGSVSADKERLPEEKRLPEENRMQTGNARLFETGQIRTLSEAALALEQARESGSPVILSDCTGGTENTFPADLAVAFGLKFFRAGAPCRLEHVAKYNRLLRIEDALGRDAVYRSPFA